MLERARSPSSSKENKITIEFNFIPLGGLKLNFPYMKNKILMCVFKYNILLLKYCVIISQKMKLQLWQRIP